MRDRAARHGRVVAAVGLGLGALYAVVTREPIRFEWAPVALLVAAALALSFRLPSRRELEAESGVLVLTRYGLLALLISCLVAGTGGANSQLWLLYGLVALFVSWSFDSRTEVAFAIGTGVLYVLTTWVAGGLPARGPLLARLGGLALLTLAVSLLCRESRDAHERALVAARDAAALAEARRAVAEQAQRLNGLQSEFVSTVSHELRTPLTAIIG